MKFKSKSDMWRVTCDKCRPAPGATVVTRHPSPVTCHAGVAGFTMIEIALCLAIIGFALVSILLVLPSGMNTQRDTREETIINQDATMLLEAIRGGARGLDDLTNNVYAITNYISFYNDQGVFQPPVHVAGYTRYTASYDGVQHDEWAITNGLRIIGLLSTPEFLNTSSGQPITSTFNTFYTSNHVVAYVRSFSGLAAEKPPQDNPIMQDDSFKYRLYCVNAPMAADTNVLLNPGFTRQLGGNLRELRLTFIWPLLPNGDDGRFRQTFRASVGGQLVEMNYGTLSPPGNGMFPGIGPLYFYQSQSFTNQP